MAQLERPSAPSPSALGFLQQVAAWHGGCLMHGMSTTDPPTTGSKQADDLELLDPTESALAAMEAAGQALEESLAATISAATDLVADCRLALAVCTAWQPRPTDTI